MSSDVVCTSVGPLGVGVGEGAEVGAGVVVGSVGDRLGGSVVGRCTVGVDGCDGRVGVGTGVGAVVAEGVGCGVVG